MGEGLSSWLQDRVTCLAMMDNATTVSVRHERILICATISCVARPPCVVRSNSRESDCRCPFLGLHVVYAITASSRPLVAAMLTRVCLISKLTRSSGTKFRLTSSVLLRSVEQPHFVAGETPAFDLISARMRFWAWVDVCDDPEHDLTHGSCVQPLSRARGNGKYQPKSSGVAVGARKCV